MSIEARIERMVYGGEGLARIEGKVALVPLVLPGELVEVVPVKSDAKLLRGRAAKIIEPAANRVEAVCPYFARCGGCHYQHAPYADQVRYKSEILVETLKRIGKIEAPEPELLTGEPLNYRNRAQFKLEKDGRDFRLGYYAAASARLIEIDQCPISSPGINAAIPALIALGRRQDFPDGNSEVEVVDGGGELLITLRSEARYPETLVSAFREHIPSMVSLARADMQGGFFRLWGRGHVIIRAAGFDYRVSHGVFFQVNRHLADSLADAVTRDLSGGLALDLYSGAGFFTLPMARRFAKVIAVESSNAANKDLRTNCTRAGLENVEANRTDTAEFLANYGGQRSQGGRPAKLAGARPDAVIIDPPRAGLGQTTSRHIGVVALTCDCVCVL